MSQTRSPSAGSLFNHPFSFSKKPGAESRSTTPGFPVSQLHIRVTGGEHSGETRGFLFAPPTFTRLFKMSMISHDLQRAFAVDLFFQTPQGLINRFAFFKLNFGQTYSLPLQRTSGRSTSMAGAPLRSGPFTLFCRRQMSNAK